MATEHLGLRMVVSLGPWPQCNRRPAPQAQQELTAAREEVAMLRQAAAADEQGNEMLAELDALKSARAEIAALRSAIQQVGCDLTRAVAVVCLAFLQPCSVSAHLSSDWLQPLVLQAGHAQGGGSFSTRILPRYLTPDGSCRAGRKDHDDCTGGGGGSQH